MIGEIKKQLREHGALTLRQLARHFEMAPEAIEPMLALLARKGQLRTKTLCDGCSGCACADAADRTLYELANGDTPVVSS
jgi:hypothetical protein